MSVCRDEILDMVVVTPSPSETNFSVSRALIELNRFGDTGLEDSLVRMTTQTKGTTSFRESVGRSH
jgi:hypothetical protein